MSGFSAAGFLLSEHGGINFDVDIGLVLLGGDISALESLVVPSYAFFSGVLFSRLQVDGLGVAQIVVNSPVEKSVSVVSSDLFAAGRSDLQALEVSVGINARREDGGGPLVPQHRVNEALKFRGQRSFRVEQVEINQVLSADDLLGISCSEHCEHEQKDEGFGIHFQIINLRPQPLNTACRQWELFAHSVPMPGHWPPASVQTEQSIFC